MFFPLHVYVSASVVAVLSTPYRCIAMILSSNVLQLIWIFLCNSVSGYSSALLFFNFFLRAFSFSLAHFFRWCLFFFARQQIIFFVVQCMDVRVCIMWIQRISNDHKKYHIINICFRCCFTDTNGANRHILLPCAAGEPLARHFHVSSDWYFFFIVHRLHVLLVLFVFYLSLSLYLWFATVEIIQDAPVSVVSWLLMLLLLFILRLFTTHTLFASFSDLTFCLWIWAPLCVHLLLKNSGMRKIYFIWDY